MNCATRILGAGLRVGVGAGIAVLLLQSFLVLGAIAPFRVEGDSMVPTLADGERILVDRTAYWFRSPARWQIVVLRCPHEPLTYCVKRIVGLPGERVQIRDGRVLVNGAVAEGAPDVRYGSHRKPNGDVMEYQLGQGEYFVLGDNSLRSIDSRMWGTSAVRRNAILGQARRFPGSR